MATGDIKKVEEVKASRFEKLLLPSKGKFYPPEWTENGCISVRPMTIEEEMILTTPRFIKKGVALDMIFKACLENQKIDTQELLSGDRSFLLYNLRCISYGAAYDFETKCQACGFRIKDTYNLNLIKVKFIDDKIIEPLVFTLPISKKTVKFRFMRGKDELKLVQNREYRLNTFDANVIDNTILERFELVTEEFDGKTDRFEISRMLKTMIAGDAAALRNFMLDSETGIDTSVTVICPNCSDESIIDVPVGVNFFSLSKTTK